MRQSGDFDTKRVEEINRKAIENQFFTPDHVYLDMALFKEYPLGVIFADKVHHNKGEAEFCHVQNHIKSQLTEYQKRLYDTIDPFLSSLGYTDDHLEDLIKVIPHDLIFMMSPATNFLKTVIRHTIRNKNNSAPANKFVKKSLDQQQYTLESMPVTYYINTFPLTLSLSLQQRLAPELGEALGVNVQFLNKDPQFFNQQDWDRWLSKIDCLYLHSFGRLSQSSFFIQQQENMMFAGVYFFARKRLEKRVMAEVKHLDIEHQIQLATAQLDMLCDFAWLANNDARLTDEPDQVKEPPTEPQGT
jgi:hypothetical protein